MQQSTLVFNEHYTPVIACREQPQERFESFGAAALSDTELIAIILHTGIRDHSVLRLASQLIAEAGSLARLASWNPEDFRKIKGIGRAKGQQLAALVEISRRMSKQQSEQDPLFSRPDAIATYMAPYVKGLEVEKFWVACLNRKNRLKKLVEVTSGTATAALAHPREVFRTAVQHGATAIVCMHNHPSFDPAPSAADQQVTRRLCEAARTVDIPLLDHVIIGTPAGDPVGIGYFSFRSAGHL